MGLAATSKTSHSHESGWSFSKPWPIRGKAAPCTWSSAARCTVRPPSNGGEVQPYDEFWILIDTDHRFEGRHLTGSHDAIRQAQQAGIRVAVSNPCFELWLLLHHEPVASGATFDGCGGVEERLRLLLGSFNKASINRSHFPLAKVHDAIRNARALEGASESAEHRWPRSVGTQIHRLLESILNPPG